MLVVIVNNDKQVAIKGSEPFMIEEDRFRVVSSLKDVDYTYLSTDEGSSVSDSLLNVYYLFKDSAGFESMTFANGGDRKQGDIPEVEVCERLGIKHVYGIGGEKVESSSRLLHKSKIRGV